MLKKLLNVLTIIWGRSPTPGLWTRVNTDFDYVLKAVALCPIPMWRGTSLETVTPYIAQLLWYVKAPFEIASYVGQYGAELAESGGPSLAAQVLKLLQLAYVNRVSPELVYRYRLFNDHSGSSARRYIQGSTCSAIIGLINRKDMAVLEDKNFVADTLLSNGCPAVPSWVSATNGELTIDPDISNRWPESNMILKPNDGTQGEGIEFVKFTAKNQYEYQGKVLTFEELLQHIKQLSAQRHYLLQPCLRNHKNLRHFAPDSLTTLRILTALHEDQRVEPIYGVFRVGPLGRVMDNFSIGGLAAAIDLESGIVGLGRQESVLSLPQKQQVNSNNDVAGTKIPFWNEALAVCCQAHLLFPEYVFLGWDVAITDDGPFLIEVNAGWCCKVIQMPESLALGDTSFASIAKRALQSAA